MERTGSELRGGRLYVRDLGPVREIRLARPDVHNALDEELIHELTRAFTEISCEVAADSAPPTSATPGIPPRAVLLTAEGKSFCAGADLNYMQRLAGFTPEENRADARRLAGLFRAVYDCPVYVLGRIQGAALGGGCGLISCCDFTVAATGARFGFTEVRLGIAPATISPFVVARIGAARARALFPTGAIFDASEAQQIGLIDRVVAGDQLDAEIDRVLATLLSVAPRASRAAKALANDAAASTAEQTAELIARLRALPEGREGIAAFLERRQPTWTVPWPRTDDSAAAQDPA
jgi:methylglutaconyl-CoA hydratase